jgi:hypothetical protein
MGHPGCRRVAEQCKERIKIMFGSGTAPKDILTNIQLEFPASNCTSREIYNFATVFEWQDTIRSFVVFGSTSNHFLV